MYNCTQCLSYCTLGSCTRGSSMMSHAIDSPPSKEGTRERKQRETRFRIAESGLRLFMENGYDGTTVEAIAQAAGISRRTFFAYFKSKDEILFAWMAAG